jgi:GrpB-like predicted nucleotidyltransferase (UPF0157 family)
VSETREETVSFLPEEHFRSQVLQRFECLKLEFTALIPGADIQHVGSTAIPGSLTKGDLDIQVRVVSSTYPGAKQRLSEIYDVNIGGFAADDAVSFEDYTSVPSVGIHLTVIGGSADIQWRFRDLLTASESRRQEYDDLKRQFEGKSMMKYRKAKEAFVTRVLDGG